MWLTSAMTSPEAMPPMFISMLPTWQRHDGKVDDNVGQRVHQGGDVAHVELHLGQQFIGVTPEAVHLSLLSLSKARTTRTPVRFSRVRPRTRSRRVCTDL